ncbi:hypothetical protein ACFL7D_00845 [candidate division KSB1 bacterium]
MKAKDFSIIARTVLEIAKFVASLFNNKKKDGKHGRKPGKKEKDDGKTDA